MTEWTTLQVDGTRLALADLGGEGPPALFLHGLAGHAEEWRETASWLSDSHRVFALDLRGHGRSERRPSDLSRDALIADVVAALVHIGEPVVLVGQSLGGWVAFHVAASHASYVRALVIVEADLEGPAPEEAAAVTAEVESKLRAWPVPFQTEQEAVNYFGGSSLVATAWVSGLEARDDGMWPRFDIDVVIRMLRESLTGSIWHVWEAITCPVLVVSGQRGSLSEAQARRMVTTLPQAQLATVDAGHDVHLENPAAWRDVLTRFLSDLV